MVVCIRFFIPDVPGSDDEPPTKSIPEAVFKRRCSNITTQGWLFLSQKLGYHGVGHIYLQQNRALAGVPLIRRFSRYLEYHPDRSLFSQV